MRGLLASVILCAAWSAGRGSMAELEVNVESAGFSQPKGYVQVVTVTGEGKQIYSEQGRPHADGRCLRARRAAKLTFEKSSAPRRPQAPTQGCGGLQFSTSTCRRSILIRL